MQDSDLERCPVCGASMIDEKIEYETYLGHIYKYFSLYCHTCNSDWLEDHQIMKNKAELIRVKGKCVV